MGELKNIGMYIVKTYTKKDTKLIPVLKFGYTKNINVRLNHFGKKYKLIKFYPMSFPEWRETYIKNHWFSDEFRINNNEHFEFYSGLLKYMDNAILDASDYKLKKDKNGFIKVLL